MPFVPPIKYGRVIKVYDGDTITVYRLDPAEWGGVNITGVCAQLDHVPELKELGLLCGYGYFRLSAAGGQAGLGGSKCVRIAPAKDWPRPIVGAGPEEAEAKSAPASAGHSELEMLLLKDALGKRSGEDDRLVSLLAPLLAGLISKDNPLDEFPSYVRALRYIDDRIRDIVEGIDKLGLSQETLVAIVSDHGEGFGQHPGSRGHGAKVYQENVHVPFAMIGPQLAGVRGEATFPTSHIDVAPTILGLLGLDIPCTMKGRDLSSSRKPVAVLFGGRPPGAQKGLVDGKWKYIVEDNGMELLFDLWADPGEKKSLIVENKELAGKFGKMLDDWSVFSENLIENYSEIRKRSSCAPR